MKPDKTPGKDGQELVFRTDRETMESQQRVFAELDELRRQYEQSQLDAAQRIINASRINK